MQIPDKIQDILKNNSYPGRGIIVGKSEDSKYLCIAYFLTGRSENSRNRILIEDNMDVFTKAFDESKVTDPSLIIYTAIKTVQNKIIVTNGAHTDVIYNAIQNNQSFEDGLETCEFEPDAPNYTPRISAMIDMTNTNFSYKMSILKSADLQGSSCNRFYFNYRALNGIGHFIHTYMTDANPIPSFVGEPRKIDIPNDIEAFANTMWDNLSHENKISLYVKYINLENGEVLKKLINKNN